MRVGIYNRWLQTRGGGERETAAFAEVLQRAHEVDLLTHQPIDLEAFAQHFNVALPRVRLRTVADDAEYRSVIAASAEYDLFINLSHLDMFVPKARRNVLRVFFPGRPMAVADQPAPNGSAWLRSLAIAPDLRLLRDFYKPELDADRPFAWTGQCPRVLLTRQSRRSPRQVQIVLHGWRPEGAPPAQVQLSINDQAIASRSLPRDGVWTDWRVPLPPDLQRANEWHVRLQTTTFNPAELGMNSDTRDLGVALTAVRLLGGPWSASLAERLGVGVPTLGAYQRMLANFIHNIASSYDQILANSRFTQTWIERRWQVPSEIVYPPVDTTYFQPGAKQPIILSVGRFFAGSHNKKHLPMIAAFRAMYDAGLRGWEYHLAGGCDETMPEHRAYLNEVRAAAAGYPIVLHVNTPFQELQSLYSAASIFWHATGYGEDEHRDPDSFEHFGITTVEAMAAGCVPVVIAKAGQIETVEAHSSGLLWHTLDELQAYTRNLIDDPQLRERLASGAIERSQTFAMHAFEQRVRDVLNA